MKYCLLGRRGDQKKKKREEKVRLSYLPKCLLILILFVEEKDRGKEEEGLGKGMFIRFLF